MPRNLLRYRITETTPVRKLARWLRRGGVPLDKDHKPLVERPHVHPRRKRRPA